jgi:type IV pilus assembly protein PilZ
MMHKDKGHDFSTVAIEPTGEEVAVGATTSERRRFPRHAITLRVDYKRMNTFFADYAKNISKGGTFIRTTKPLDAGTEFVFVLSIPGQTDQLQLLGQVMWTVDDDHATDEHPAGMGIRFKFADASELKQLEDFVSKLMSEKLGSHVAAKLLGNT